ncbi:hypothetical protein LINGRAHAP2_LOCUS21070, partial [Linum grandiflorum]
GTRIQGDSVRAFAPYLEQHLSIGSVYGITGFTLQSPRPSYRSCRFPQWLGLSPAANFELLSPEDAAAFKPESYEFVPFAKFPSRLPPCAYLTGSSLPLSHCLSPYYENAMPCRYSLNISML